VTHYWTEVDAMFDARELLGSLIEGGMTRSTGARVGHAMGPEGLGQSGGPLGDLVGQIGGALGGGGGRGGGLADLAGGLLGGVTGAVKSGHPAAIGGLGALAGALLGGGGKAASGALGGGAMALLGLVAMNALKGWAAGQQGSGAGSPGAGALGLQGPAPEAAAPVLQDRALLLIKAMANAVKADGRIDPAEVQRIAGKVRGTGNDAEAQAFLLQELQQPMDVEAVARAVRGPEEAMQVYAASLLAIEVDTAAERDYLRQLAERLGLDAAAVDQVHRTLGVAV
jgi:uncharacterized membrane protein YebE (DUF533 family)